MEGNEGGRFRSDRDISEEHDKRRTTELELRSRPHSNFGLPLSFPAPMAEDSLIPSLSDGVVGSRFVTQDEIDSARQRRDEQWKAAYARSIHNHTLLSPILTLFFKGWARILLRNSKKRASTTVAVSLKYVCSQCPRTPRY